MKIGGRYNWKGQPERLVYLGNNWSDNELLKLAAKAASVSDGPEGFWCFDSENWWNPLTDAGDALRLAVKLNMFDTKRLMEIRLEETRINPKRSDIEIMCRAIVRTAAEIGRVIDEQD